MTHLIFHTMGSTDHIRAALSLQGISKEPDIPISVYSNAWMDEHVGGQFPKFNVTEFSTIQPNGNDNIIVVVCGSKAFLKYQNAKFVKKNIGIEKTRGQYLPFGDGSYLTTSYDPDISFPDFVSGFRADAAVAYRVASTGLIAPALPVPVMRARSVTTILSFLEDSPEISITVSLDLETMGLDPYKKGAKIICVSLTWVVTGDDVPRCQVIYTLNYTDLEWTLLAEGLNEILNHPRVKVIGANLKYDLAWLARKAVNCSRFIFDTLLGGSMVDENRWNSLNQHAKTYTDFGGYDDIFNAEFDKAHMEEVPEMDTIEYGGGDTQACYFSAKKILTELKDISRGGTGEIQKRTPYNFYNTILHPAARAFERIEQRGMYVDLGAFHEFGGWAAAERIEHEVMLSKMLPQSLKSKYENWADYTPALVSHYLFDELGIQPKQYTAKSKKPSTAWSHLQSFQDHPECGEFVTRLKELNAIKKLHSTYYVGWLKHLRDDDLFHPTYWLHRAGMGDEGGAVTGRSSVTDPAVQTLPKHTEVAKRLRKCFNAPPGYYIAGLDYSQGELRIIACVANETTMLKVYENNGDLHAVTAAKMLEMPLPVFLEKAETEPVWYERARRNGKAGNFGLVYGMSANGYVHYAWTSYGVELEYEDAEGQRDTFFETYPRLLGYHGIQTQEVKREKQVMSPLGRVRHLPHIDSDDQFYSGKARRQAINAPIQSTLADMSFWSIARLHQHYENIWVWGNIHDQNLLYVPIDGWEEQIGQAKEVMENLPFEEAFGWQPQLKFPVDTLIGPNLGELYDTGKFDG